MRPLMLAGLALAAGVSAWTAFHGDDNEVEPVRHDPGAKSAKRTPADTRSLAKSPLPTNLADVQALTQGVPHWQSRVALASRPLGAANPWASQRPPPPPPPPVAVAEPPPPPMAPPFPHTWVGRFDDKAVVAGRNTTWVVGPGDVIEGQWRVDQVQERQLTLTYLPLNQSQTVAMKAP